MTRAVATVAIGLAFASTPAAHHSPSLFDRRTEVKIRRALRDEEESKR